MNTDRPLDLSPVRIWVMAFSTLEMQYVSDCRCENLRVVLGYSNRILNIVGSPVPGYLGTIFVNLVY